MHVKCEHSRSSIHEKQLLYPKPHEIIKPQVQVNPKLVITFVLEKILKSSKSFYESRP
jgi:hypothetical protein